MSFLSPGFTIHRAFNMIFGDLGSDVHVCTAGPVWSAKVSPTSDQWGSLNKLGDRYVATGRGQAGATPTNTIFSIDKGATWSVGGLITNAGNTTPSPVRSDGVLRLVGYMAFFSSCVSTDAGVSWTVTTPGVAFAINGLRFGNGLFVYVGVTANTYASATGLAVTQRATPAIFQDVWWNPNTSLWIGFEASGVRTWTSPDLGTWTIGGNMPRNGSSFSAVDNIAQNGATIIVSYGDGTPVMMISTDNGATWGDTGVTAGQTVVNSLLYANGQFMAQMSLAGRVITSPIGMVWALSANTLTATKNWHVVYDGINTYIAVGGSGADDTVTNQGLC